MIIHNVIEQKRSLNEVSMIFNVPRSTVWNIVSAYRKSQRIESINRYGGRKRKFSLSDSSEIAQLATNNPLDSLSSLKKEFESLHPGKNISVSTIHAIIKHTNAAMTANQQINKNNQTLQPNEQLPPPLQQNEQLQQQQQNQQNEQQQQQNQQQQDPFLNQQNLLSSTMAMPMSNDSYQIQRPLMDNFSSDSFCYQSNFFGNTPRSLNIYQSSVNSLSDNSVTYPSQTIAYENNIKQT